MKFEVIKNNNGKYCLRIDGELILVHEKLSTIVNKIEQFLKIRYLTEEQKGGVIGFVDKIMKGK